MKLRAPSGCASICHDGRIFVVADDGSVDVPKAMASALAAHGFTPWAEDDAVPVAADETGAASVDIDALTRAELFALLRDRGVKASRRDTNVMLRAAVRAALES